MAKFWQSKKFEDLNTEWRARLKASGFIDAEKEVNGELVLAHNRASEGGFGSHLRATPRAQRESKAEYFILLFQHVTREQAFEDELDRLIMERTAEGRRIKEISEELKSALPEGRLRSKHHRNTICFVRRRYENKWGIKVWKPEQMVSRKKKAATR